MKPDGWRSFAKRFWHLAGGVSVRTKIFGIVLGSTILLSLGFTLQVRTTQRALLEQRSQEQGLSIARDVAARATDLILVHDFYSLRQLLIETQNNYRDIRYVFVISPQGEVLAHTFEGGFPLDLAAVNPVSSQDFQNTILLETNEGLIWDVAVPVFEGKAGAARVGISGQSVSDTMAELTSQLLTTLVGVLAVSLLAATFLTWILTRPILDLVEATRAVGQGDFSPRVRRWANDEIGDLAVAFNQMAEELERLEEIRREREQLRRKLLESVIAAQEEERRRIARELHDSTSQSLTSLKVGLATIEQACNQGELRLQVEELRSVLNRTLDEVHTLAVQLRPSVLDDLGLEAALQRLVGEWQARSHIPIDLVVHLGDQRLPDEVETALYRIVQEALTNILRHAQASSVSVLIERLSSHVIAVIEDNGIGFTADSLSQHSQLGLLGIRERAELLGGSLTIESQPGRGSSLYVRLPWPHVRDAETNDEPFLHSIAG